jgi:hypothetical protein
VLPTEHRRQGEVGVASAVPTALAGKELLRHEDIPIYTSLLHTKLRAILAVSGDRDRRYVVPKLLSVDCSGGGKNVRLPQEERRSSKKLHMQNKAAFQAGGIFDMATRRLGIALGDGGHLRRCEIVVRGKERSSRKV